MAEYVEGIPCSPKEAGVEGRFERWAEEIIHEISWYGIPCKLCVRHCRNLYGFEPRSISCDLAFGGNKGSVRKDDHF